MGEVLNELEENVETVRDPDAWVAAGARRIAAESGGCKAGGRRPHTMGGSAGGGGGGRTGKGDGKGGMGPVIGLPPRPSRSSNAGEPRARPSSAPPLGVSR